MKKRLTKRIISFMLALVLTVNSTSIMVSAEKSDVNSQMIGGSITSLMNLKFGALAQDYVERTILKTLGVVAEKEGDSDLGKVLTGTKKILGSSVGNSLGNITGLCNEILAEVQVIHAKLDECNEKMDDFAVSSHYAAYQTDRSQLIDFKNTYNALYNKFTTFLNAMAAYEADMTQENFDAVKTAYEAVEAFYVENPNVLNSEYTTLDFNFVNDLDDFLQLISSYLPSQQITQGIAPSDSAYWGEDQNVTTYVDNVFVCLKDYYPYEHQILEEMKTASSEVAGIASLYLTVLRMYTEVGVIILSEDPSLAEDQRSQEIAGLWNVYSENAYKLIRGIEQMCKECDTYTKGYMTSLDTNATIEVDNTDTWGEKKTFPNESEFYATTTADKITNDELEFYQVKSPDYDYTYAILKGISANNWGDGTELSNSDLVDVAAEITTAGVTSTYRAVSADYMKLTNSDASKVEYTYTMLSSAEELRGLISGAAFNGHLYSYLKSQLGAAELPETSEEISAYDETQLKSGTLVPLYTNLSEWEPAQAGDDRDMDFPAVNIAMPLDPSNLSRNTVSIDTEDDVADEGGNKTNPLVILKGTEQMFTLQKNYDDSKGSVSVEDEDGAEAKGHIYAGTSLVAKVKAHSGNTIKSVYLRRVDSNGSIITDEKPYYLAGGSDEETTSLGEALSVVQTDEEGYYSFHFTAPYVQAALCVEFEKGDPLESYTVSLDSGANGVMMFADGFGLTEKEYHPGDKVVVLVRPYSGYLVSYVDGSFGMSVVNDESLLFAPNMKAYSFTMPAYDVSFQPVYEAGYKAELDLINAGEGCSAQFVYPNSAYCAEGWLTADGTFAEGSKVTIKTTGTDKYYVSEVMIVDYSSNDYITGDLSGDTITFTMPSGNIGIEVTYNKVEARSYTATLSKTGTGELCFVDAKGNIINSVKNTFEEGSTVVFTAVTDHLWDGVITIVDAEGNAVELTDLGNNQYSFVMPGCNVSISTEFAEEITVYLDEPSGWSNVFYFMVDGAAKNYISSMTYWEGDTITIETNKNNWQSGLNIKEMLAKDSDGNPVAVTSDGNTHTIIAGEKDITVYSDYETYVEAFFTEGLAADNMRFVGGGSYFPGYEIYFTWIGTMPENVVVSAVDVNGNPVEITETDFGYLSLILPDCNVYITADEYVEGVCVSCGRYQAPILNADGYYEIRNAGQLMWFMYMVNGIDSELAVYGESNPSANALLMNDIDMSVIKEDWIALGRNNGGYRGIFDGQNHTIYNLKINSGLLAAFTEKGFAVVSGTGTVKNLHVKNTSGETVENQTVKTGDTSNIWLWLAILALSGTGIVFVVKKKKYQV